jgi:predicted Fe-Mo cluster-binding NifX family protein
MSCAFFLAMKVAVPILRGRVSPVFDVAERLLVVDIENGREAYRHEVPITETVASRRTACLTELGIDTLVCGAISRPLEEMIGASGIQVFPWRCGPVENVLHALLCRRLTEEAYAMPGCCGRRRQVRGGWRHGGSCEHGPAQVRPTDQEAKDIEREGMKLTAGFKSKNTREKTSSGHGTGSPGDGPGTGRAKGLWGGGHQRGGRNEDCRRTRSG